MEEFVCSDENLLRAAKAEGLNTFNPGGVKVQVVPLYLPSISIIIPTYNSEKVLPLCLESIKNQNTTLTKY